MNKIKSTKQKPRRPGRGYGMNTGQGSSLTSNCSNMKDGRQPIYRSDGKVIGHVEESTYMKQAIADKHMMKTPRGWGSDIDALDQALQYGASQMEIHDTKTRIVYRCSIEEFFAKGVPRDFGYGEQLILPLRYWVVIRPGDTPAKQLTLGI